MKIMKRTILLILSFIALLALSCCPSYTMKAPDSFKRFEKSNDFNHIVCLITIKPTARRDDDPVSFSTRQFFSEECVTAF